MFLFFGVTSAFVPQLDRSAELGASVMLIIRSEQFQLLGSYAFGQYVERMIGEARSDWPEVFEAMGEERAVTAVKASIDTALKQGFETEFDVGRFVLLAFAFRSFGFLREPWAIAALDPELPPRERMNRLFASALTVMPE